MKLIKRFILVISIMVIALSNLSSVEAKSDNIIIFKDQHLLDELTKYYNWDYIFTQEAASELTEKCDHLFLENAKISDLEGLQYFENLVTLYVGGNNLKSLKPLSKLYHLKMLVISNSLKKGTEFEKLLSTSGRIKNLETIWLNNDGLSNIEFLEKIGYINKYDCIEMSDNKIVDISVLKNATNLTVLDLSNNRIQDVSALANLDKLTFCIDLRDNCIIDYSPIKHLFDEMYKEFDTENNMPRYDYSENPFNFKYNGTLIEFPYLTAEYKSEAYAEAKPLFKAFGGSAKYDKKIGKLTCKYKKNTYVFTDFSSTYTINGKTKKMTYPMRRMQYDLAYVPVEEICKMLGFTYTEVFSYEIVDKMEVIDDNAIPDPVLFEITSK